MGEHTLYMPGPGVRFLTHTTHTHTHPKIDHNLVFWEGGSRTPSCRVTPWDGPNQTGVGGASARPKNVGVTGPCGARTTRVASSFLGSCLGSALN